MRERATRLVMESGRPIEHVAQDRASASSRCIDDYATHRVPLEQAPHAYEIFQKKQDRAFKILLQPNEHAA
ncbi:MAG: hypothetical protein M3401_04750 [Actinomycetota bacterium]|nr:hypothetical protein [Actinomycetota bacterium]